MPSSRAIQRGKKRETLCIRMANRSRPSQEKRNRERARQERQKVKLERRLEAKLTRSSAARQAGGEDPDIAGIVPGPQPPREDQLVDDEKE
jgi:hypothetical protein